MPARAIPQDQPSYTPYNIIPTPKTSSHHNMPYPTTLGNVRPTPETNSLLNAPYLTTLAVMSARAAFWNQLPYAPHNIFSTPKTFFSLNMPYPITPAVILIGATLRDQSPNAFHNILPTSKTSFSPNMSFLITPVVIPAKATPWDQFLDTPCNILLTPETSSLFNAPTTLATILANTQLSTSPSISLVPKTFFTNMGPISDSNDRPLSRKPLKTISSNIWQKQYTIYRRKVPNLYEVVINFCSSNAGSILANSSFENISFASNEDDWENSTLEIIYNSSDQISDIGINIEYKPVKEGPERGKKQQLTLEEK